MSKHLYDETIRRLYNYHKMIAEVEQFEDDCLDRRRPGENDYIKGTYVADPTVKAAVELVDPPAHIKETKSWIETIKTAWQEMELYSPELARVLECCFGLEGKARRYYDLTEELNVSLETLYRRRREAVEWVKDIALYKGLLDPIKERPA